MKASKEDSKLFYKLVNKQRCTTTNATSEISYNDENFNTPSQICDGFYKYFRDLAIPKIIFSDNTRVRIFFFAVSSANIELLSFSCKDIKTRATFFQDFEKDIDIFLVQEH